MSENIGLSEANRTYWSQRSTSYSDVNKEELAGISRHNWSAVLHEEIYSHFPGRSPESISVLDVGTGPGFFAILLAESGFHVTAVDMTPEMLEEARQNAGPLDEKIDFREMNAEHLCLPDDSYDLVVSRNLTWNLPHPEKAYSEWHRVLRTGGLLLNFDASSAELGLGDQNIGENFDVMEDIARSMPLSGTTRPAWDISVLSRLGFTVSTDEDIWKKVWTIQEKTNFSSTPMFMVSAKLREGLI